MPDLSLGLQACYEYESFKKADGIEALVMGCPIPPYFAVSTSLLLSGAYLLRDSLCYGRSAVIKTKIQVLLQLFCDWQLSFAPCKARIGCFMADHLRFCALIRDSTARNNCQSQKSCSQDWFFVFGLPGWLSRLRYRRDEH